MNRIHVYLTPAFVLLLGVTNYAQEIDVKNYNITAPKEKHYHTKILLTNGQTVKGVIKRVGFYTIELEKVIYKSPQPDSATQIPNHEISYTTIKSIKIRSVGAAIVGSVAGTLIGAIIGGLAGFIGCKDCNTSDERLGSAFLGTMAGAGLGAVGGAILGPPSFEIGGQYVNFEKFKSWMDRKRMKREP